MDTDGPATDPLEIHAFWEWDHDFFFVRVSRIDGGGAIPNDVRQRLRKLSEYKIGNDAEQWQAAKALIDQVSSSLPTPPSFEVAGVEVQGEITDIVKAHSKRTDEGPFIVVQYEITRTDGSKTIEPWKFRPSELTELHREQAEQLHRTAHTLAWERLAQNYGGGRIDPEKWSQEKTKVFISHRGYAKDAAQELFTGLGEYEDQTVFLPLLDRVDMQAGNWIEQLEGFVASCRVFIPVLTRDYLEGPVSKAEFHQALRQYFQDNKRRLIPVLIEGEPEDYTETFLGSFNMVQAQDGITEEKIDEIAHLALGLSRNPFR